jgi:transcriptional regulator with XRE-family HTH domain
MKTISEKAAFTQRLSRALKDARIEPGSPTLFAREFNRRYHGKPISVHAARKWLTGESIPTQDKLRVLAAWLGVSTEWLRFGEKASSVQLAEQEQAAYNRTDWELCHVLSSLSDEHKLIVREVVLALRRIEGKN